MEQKLYSVKTSRKIDEEEYIEYAGGILAMGQRILHENDSASRKVILWLSSYKPIYLIEEVANEVLDVLQRTAREGTSFEVKTYTADVKEIETKTFKQERTWKL